MTELNRPGFPPFTATDAESEFLGRVLHFAGDVVVGLDKQSPERLARIFTCLVILAGMSDDEGRVLWDKWTGDPGRPDDDDGFDS